MQRHFMALTWQKHTTVILSFRPSTEYRELLERSWSPHEVILCLFGLRKHNSKLAVQDFFLVVNTTT